MSEKTIRKNYKFDPATVMAIEGRDKEIYPVEADFVRDAVKHFAVKQKIESMEKRLDFLYQHLELDAGRTAEKDNRSGKNYLTDNIDVGFGL